MKRIRLIWIISPQILIGISGCITDRPVDDPFTRPVGVRDDKSCDGGECEIDTSAETRLGSDGYLIGAYGLFFMANANWAPGAVESYPDNTHTGWGKAQCYECHAAGMPDEPEDHDPRMQYWPWACARGFPGSSCHGHGAMDDSDQEPNNAPYFNHDHDAAFDGCTQSGCHDLYDAPKEREGHGFTDAPDSFCNSCHDYYWHQTGWPPDPLAPSSTNKKQ